MQKLDTETRLYSGPSVRRVEGDFPAQRKSSFVVQILLTAIG